MTLALPCEASTLFDFLSRPSHLLEISPPDLQIELVNAPNRLQLGTQLTVRGRRWGMSQTFVSEVTAFEPHALIIEEQRSGPLRRFRHERRIQDGGGSVQLSETLEYESPGGMMGLLLTAERIERELRPLLAFRQQKIAALFARPGA